MVANKVNSVILPKPTKQLFLPITFGNPLIAPAGIPCGVKISSGGQNGIVTFTMPGDFNSIVNCWALGIAYAGNDTTKMKLSFASNYGTDGQLYNIHSETSDDQDSADNTTTSKFCAWELSGILSALASGDRVGIRASYTATAVASDVSILGVKLNYA